MTLPFPTPAYSPSSRADSTAGDAAFPLNSGTWLLALVIAASLGFRVALALATDFPINDGALFYEFVKSIAASFPSLPETVRYNGMDVPFAYPPLSFWIGALLTQAGIDPLALIQYAPIALNAGYLLLFALVLLNSGHSPTFVAITLVFFGARMRSFEWLVMGGGLSRGAGALFLMLTLLALRVPGESSGKATDPLPPGRILLAGVCVAGAILSHLEWGLLAACSFVLSRAFLSHDVKELIVGCAIGGITSLLLILPWLVFVHGAHGLAPFLAAGGTSGWGVFNPPKQVVALLLSSLGNPFLLVGGAVLLMRRRYFWFLFLLLCMLATPRHGLTPVTLALSVISAQGVTTAWERLSRLIRPPLLAAGVTALGVIAILLMHEGPQYGLYRKWLKPLPVEERQAMAWVRQKHPGATFAIVSDAPWQYDSGAEWFPTLSGATSLTTVQGREWLPDSAFSNWVAMNNSLIRSETCPDLLRRLRRYGQPQFVWTEMLSGCFRRPGYEPVYRNKRVTIFRAIAAHRPSQAQSEADSAADASSTTASVVSSPAGSVVTR